MKKFVSTILIFTMLFTGAAATSCFAQAESYQLDADNFPSINVNIDIQAEGGEARAESKASASSGSRFSKIAKIALCIAIFVIVKKYVKANMDNMKAVLEDVKSYFKDLPRNLTDKLSNYGTENINMEQEEQGVFMDSEKQESKIASFKSFIVNLFSDIKSILWQNEEQEPFNENGVFNADQPIKVISSLN